MRISDWSSDVCSSDLMIGDRHDLAQLVGDQHHSHALPAQRIEDAEELIRLLRCQHPRRLVENENVGATVERLQNLDALLLAARYLASQRVGVDLEAVVARQAPQLGPRLPDAAGKVGTGFGTQQERKRVR